MAFWPEQTIAAAQERFQSAEALLNVIPADKIDTQLDPQVREQVTQQRPVNGTMQ